MKVITTIIFTLLITISLQARKPSVEPVTGIAIDDYKEVTPTQTSGFDFTNKDSIKSKNQDTSESSSSLTVLLFILGALPFVVWFSLMKKLESPTTEPAPSKPQLKVVENQHDDEDQDFPKAS